MAITTRVKTGEGVSLKGTPLTNEEIDTNFIELLGKINSEVSTRASEDAKKQDTLTFDSTPTEGSSNPVTSDGIKKAIDSNGSLPSLSGNSGKFLSTDGSGTSWKEVDALPDQSGNSGKVLTTNGTTASWANMPSDDTKADVSTLESYLPLSGGQMTGGIVSKAGYALSRPDSSNALILLGSNYPNSASLTLYGKDYPTRQGVFELKAKDDTDTKSLRGYPDGTLYWAGEYILTSASTLDHTKLDESYLPLAGGKMTGQLSLYGDAALHNSVWRGNYLGKSITSAQFSSIIAGTFDDLYIGDYWTVGGINYRIAAIDYYYNVGDIPCEAHHVVVVPDTIMYEAQMNSSDTVEGAYVGSKMYQSYLAQAQSEITSAFGSDHLLSIRQFFENAVANECVSSSTWCDATIWLMSEVNVYGCRLFGSATNGTSFPNIYKIDNRQYPLFAFGNTINSERRSFWLRDVSNRSTFATVGGSGHATAYYPSNSAGVRPAFCIGKEIDYESI